MLAAALSLVALILAVVLLPETRYAGAPFARRHWLSPALLQALRMPDIGALIVTFFLATVAFGTLESTLALMNQFFLTGGGEVKKITEMPPEQIDDVFKKSSLIFAYVGITLMIVQGFIYRRLVKRVGEVPFMRVGTALMVVGLAGVIATVLGVAHVERINRTHLIAQAVAAQGLTLPSDGAANFPQVVVSSRVASLDAPALPVWIIPAALIILAILVMGFALMTPSVQALISRRADPARQGEILGANQSASALARIVGPAIGSALFFVESSHVLPYVVGACLMVVVFLLTLRLRPA
jgi:hypothetical protein